MKLAIFRSLWGATNDGTRALRSLPEVLDALAAQRDAASRASAADGGSSWAYAGVEASLDDLGSNSAARRAAAETLRGRGLRVIVAAYTSWRDYGEVRRRDGHLPRLCIYVHVCALSLSL